MICFSRATDIETQGEYAVVQWNRIREATARAMLRMLRHAPAALSENSAYRFEANLERVQTELGLNDLDFS